MVDVFALAPELILIGGAMLFFLWAPFREEQPGTSSPSWPAWSCTFLLVASSFWFVQSGWTIPVSTNSFLRFDGFAHLLRGIGLGTGFLLLLMGWTQVIPKTRGEYHACLLLVIAGSNLTALANDLVAMFLALELVSIPTYILLYVPKPDSGSREATIKYFLLSIFSSAVLLYGFSFLYGFAGTTNLHAIRLAIHSAGSGPIPGILVIALVMVVGGLAFRVTAVPFHFYAPDVFQGAPLVGAALLAMVPKIVGFAALSRLVTATLMLEPASSVAWSVSEIALPLLWLIAVATMVVGNVLGLLQYDLRRLLAYSSIAHAGYMLVGLAAGGRADVFVSGTEAVFFYLVIYGIMTLGAFSVLAFLSSSERPVTTIDDLAGLSQVRPLAAFMLAICLFSLTGLPPTAGFIAKFSIFWAAWSKGNFFFQSLALIMAINAAMGAWYYLRVVSVMYLLSPLRPRTVPTSASEELNATLRAIPCATGMFACAFLVLYLFFQPATLWRGVHHATDSFSPTPKPTPMAGITPTP